MLKPELSQSVCKYSGVLAEGGCSARGPTHPSLLCVLKAIELCGMKEVFIAD